VAHVNAYIPHQIHSLRVLIGSKAARIYQARSLPEEQLWRKPNQLIGLKNQPDKGVSQPSPSISQVEALFISSTERHEFI